MRLVPGAGKCLPCLPGQNNGRFQERAPIRHKGEALVCVRRKVSITIRQSQRVSMGSNLCLAQRSSSSLVMGQSVLHRPGQRPPHSCPSPYPTLEPCTQVQEPVSELEKQLQVCEGSGDGYRNTKRCLLHVMSLLVTNLALHYLPHPSVTFCKLWAFRIVAGQLEYPSQCSLPAFFYLAHKMQLNAADFCDPVFSPVGFRCLFLSSFLVAICVNI